MKLLIISAAAGAGHVRAAQAIKKQAKTDHPDWEIEHIDILNFLSISPRKIFFDSYGMITKKAPFLWRWIFYIFNQPNVTKISDKIMKSLILIHTNKIIDFVNWMKPDVIICTHPTATNIITTQEKNITQKSDLWTVVTDYKIHLFWVNKRSKYFVPNESVKKQFVDDHKFDPKNIIISGIPIDIIFYETETTNLKMKYGLENKPTVLVLSGGEGLIKTDKIIKEVLKTKIPLNVIAIAGNNNKLKEKLMLIKPPTNIHYQPIGWTDKISDYMKLSDIIITKPGGMTITECLTLKKPIIIVEPIPGQEEYNTEFLLKNNLATLCPKIKKINKYLFPLLKEKPAINWPVVNSAKIILETISKN